MGKKKDVPAAVSEYMASIGSKGGRATGDSKARGNAEYYQKLVEKRWGKKAKKK